MSDTDEFHRYFAQIEGRKAALEARGEEFRQRIIDAKLVGSEPIFPEGVQGDRDKMLAAGLLSTVLALFVKTPGLKLDFLGADIEGIPTVVLIAGTLAISIYFGAAFLILSRLAVVGWRAKLYARVGAVSDDVEALMKEAADLEMEMYQLASLAYTPDELKRAITDAKNETRQSRRTNWLQAMQTEEIKNQLARQERRPFAEPAEEPPPPTLNEVQALTLLKELETYAERLQGWMRGIAEENLGTIGLGRSQMILLRYAPILCAAIFFALTVWGVTRHLDRFSDLLFWQQHAAHDGVEQVLGFVILPTAPTPGASRVD